MTIPFALIGVLVAQATAQPPERGQGRGGVLRAVIQALDANQDQELSVSEIENATAALRAIDSNSDGVINKDDASGRPEGGRDKTRSNDADKDDRQKGGEGSPGRKKAGGRNAGERKDGDGGKAQGEAGKGKGRDKMADDEGGAGRRGGAGEGRGDRFVKQAMKFDTDGDGKLSVDS